MAATTTTYLTSLQIPAHLNLEQFDNSGSTHIEFFDNFSPGNAQIYLFDVKVKLSLL